MQIIIDYNGKTYKSKEASEVSQDKAFDAIYDDFEMMQKLNIELEDGGRLIMGTEALRRAIIKVMP